MFLNFSIEGDIHKYEMIFVQLFVMDDMSKIYMS